jgi:hypothetical protein
MEALAEGATASTFAELGVCEQLCAAAAKLQWEVGGSERE